MASKTELVNTLVKSIKGGRAPKGFKAKAPTNKKKTRSSIKVQKNDKPLKFKKLTLEERIAKELGKVLKATEAKKDTPIIIPHSMISHYTEPPASLKELVRKEKKDKRVKEFDDMVESMLEKTEEKMEKETKTPRREIRKPKIYTPSEDMEAPKDPILEALRKILGKKPTRIDVENAGKLYDSIRKDNPKLPHDMAIRQTLRTIKGMVKPKVKKEDKKGSGSGSVDLEEVLKSRIVAPTKKSFKR